MTNQEKIRAIQCLIDKPDNEGAYYKLLEDIGGLKINYNEYMTTAPIDCDVELERVPTAGWNLNCALLTMLLREDHFSNGSFERRQRKGQVDAILHRMIELLTKADDVERPLAFGVEEKWGVIRPVAGWCKDCVYNLGDPLKANCEMFVADFNGDKPYSIHYEGKECPLYLKQTPDSEDLELFKQALVEGLNNKFQKIIDSYEE